MHITHFHLSRYAIHISYYSPVAHYGGTKIFGRTSNNEKSIVRTSSDLRPDTQLFDTKQSQKETNRHRGTPDAIVQIYTR